LLLRCCCGCCGWPIALLLRGVLLLRLLALVGLFSLALWCIRLRLGLSMFSGCATLPGRVSLFCGALCRRPPLCGVAYPVGFLGRLGRRWYAPYRLVAIGVVLSFWVAGSSFVRVSVCWRGGL
jgi:hypothetical protein